MKQFLNSILLFGFAAGLAGSFIIGTTSAQTADLMQSLQNQKRPLLLFSKSRSFAGLDQQVDLLRSYRPDLQERDMVVLSTTGNQETQSAIGYTPVDRGSARLLRKRFKPDLTGLTVILIGKDGEEKARWNRVVEPQKIFDLIDTMPTRQDEIKKAAESG